MSQEIDYKNIVRQAWQEYDPFTKIRRITDISVKVSTNHVYKIEFEKRSFLIAKLSTFGLFEHFVEDHAIINAMSNNLPLPFQNVLSRPLIKRYNIFYYKHTANGTDIWVVFYRPVRILHKPPKKFTLEQITLFAKNFAKFHLACHNTKNTLAKSSKTIESDALEFVHFIQSKHPLHTYPKSEVDFLVKQTGILLENLDKLNAHNLDRIPVFIDWNIGNFSVNSSMRIYSRWDYDWFRMSSRTMDFYFLARIVSSIGDSSIWSYNIDVFNERRFHIFIKHYHEVFPLSEKEILILPEIYRFFVLHYVFKYGRHFFTPNYAQKFQKEAFDGYFQSISRFDPKSLLKIIQ